MSLIATCRNLYAAQAFIDVTLVTIVIVAGATPRDATRSNPDTTVVDATSGAYTCTMPSGEKQISIGQETVNSPGTAPGDKITISGLSSTGGVTTFTATKSDGVALTGSEEIHLSFLVLGS